MDGATNSLPQFLKYVLLIVGCAMVLLAVTGTAYASAGTSTPQLYVCNHESRNISIIDPDSLAVTGSIEGISSPAGLAISPGGSVLYVVGSQSGTVSAVDLKTEKILRSAKVGRGADRAVISPDGSRLYVKCGNNISVIDTGTMQVVADILTGGKELKGMTLSPDGSKLYVADLKGSSLIVIDAATYQVARTITLSSLPMRVTVSPDGCRLYVACVNKAALDEYGSSSCACLSPLTLAQLFLEWISNSKPTDINGIYVIDAANYSVLSSIDTGGIPFGIALSEDGSRIYAACAEYYGSYIEVIDPSTGRIADKTPVQMGLWTTNSLKDGVSALSDGSSFYVLPAAGSMLFSIEEDGLRLGQPVEVGSDSVDMCLSPDRKKVFVASRGGNSVTIIDKEKSTISKLRLWWDPQYVAFSPDGARAYVTSENSGTVTVINVSDRDTTAIIDVGKAPRQIVVSPDGKKAYVAHYQADWQTDGIITVIDTETNSVTRKLTVGVNPRGMAFSPAGELLYVVCENPALMAVSPYGPDVKSVDEKRADTLYVFDTETDEVIKTTNVQYMPSAIAVSPDGSRLYVTCMNGSMMDRGNVRVLDARSYAQLGVIDVGAEPKGIVITPDGKYLYVVTPNDYTLTVIDTAASNVTAKISFGTYNRPYEVTMNSRGDRAYVTVGDWPAGKVVAIDTASNSIIGSTGVGSWPTGLATG